MACAAAVMSHARNDNNKRRTTAPLCLDGRLVVGGGDYLRPARVVREAPVRQELQEPLRVVGQEVRRQVLLSLRLLLLLLVVVVVG